MRSFIAHFAKFPDWHTYTDFSVALYIGDFPNEGNLGKVSGNGFCLEIPRKNQEIRQMLETIKEIFVFVSLINRFPNVLKKDSQENTCP